MITPLKLVFGVAAGVFAACLIVRFTFVLVAGLIAFVLSVALPVVLLAVVVYMLLRLFSPRSLGCFRRMVR